VYKDDHHEYAFNTGRKDFMALKEFLTFARQQWLSHVKERSE
jgi:hypothetical protein